MPYGSVQLIPGVNVERTPTLLKAGLSQSQLIRYRDSLIQKYGGWQKFFSFAIPGKPRDLHAWQDLRSIDHLSVGTTTQLGVVTTDAYQDITPQTLLSDLTPNFVTILNSTTVQVNDPNISNVTVFDSVFFNTMVSVGGIVLSGLYTITQIVGATSYDITAAATATANATGGSVPVFTTVSGSTQVEVNLPSHGRAVNDVVVFQIATTGNGVTILDNYVVISIVDSNNFNINATTKATASGSFSMNGGKAELLYYLNIGPASSGSGYGTGGYGVGGYNTGTVFNQQTGTEITATDWTSDNFGEILLACPAGGGVYQFDPTGGFTNAGLVGTAPPFNTGIFVSQSQEFLICYGSTAVQDIGVIQEPLLVKWSDVGDFTSFIPLTTNQAGDFPIPNGSRCVAGAAVANQDLIWTDIDLWAMNYQGTPFVFGFNKIGAGAGAISSHSIQALRGNVYWMGPTNFYSFTSGGVSVLPCPVWDFVFQNLNTAYQQNVRAMPNTPFNEAGWFFPSSASTSGECDSYVKFNITEPNNPWDYGALQRSAWIDQSPIGMPVGANQGGVIYQHETTENADGQSLMSSFTTGYFYIAEGEEYAFVDQILPDFKWATYGASPTAQIQMSFNVTNFPGDTPVVYGPYTVTQSTELLPVRFRGRQLSITVSSSDLGSFWRLGNVRYRFATSGRR